MQPTHEFFEKIINLLPTKRSGYSEYGSRVMPVLSLYRGLSKFEDRQAFQDSLERMLTSPDEEIRRFAVDICLGFFVFRDAI